MLNREWADHEEGGHLPTYSEQLLDSQKKVVGSADIDGVSDEDKQDEEADRFERAYNFRFEEPTGPGSGASRGGGAGHSAASHIVTYARNVKGSSCGVGMTSASRSERTANDAKPRRRRKKREELKRLKNLKRQEVEARLREIERATGASLADAGLTVADLDGDFDIDKYDAKMSKAFDDEYYGENGELVKPIDAEDLLDEDQGKI